MNKLKKEREGCSTGQIQPTYRSCLALNWLQSIFEISQVSHWCIRAVLNIEQFNHPQERNRKFSSDSKNML